LEPRTTLFVRAPNRVDLDDVVLAIVEVVDVATRLLHQHPLDHLAASRTIRLSNCCVRGEPVERLLEFVREQLFCVATLAPPLVFRFEAPLSLSEENDSHDALDTASGIRERLCCDLPRNRPKLDRARHVAPLALGASAHRR